MENINSINTLWVLLCGFLVFLMQLGFSMIETGSVRSKNTINVAMKNLIDTVFGIAFFWLIGYGIMFGFDFNGIIGLNGFAIDGSNPKENTFFFFQAMFAATAVTIISGTIAERIKFNGYIVIAIVVTSFIYPLFGHWAWADHGWLKELGFTDFAGSTVVHSMGAWIGLVGTLFLGPRLGKFSKGKVNYFAPSNHNFIVFGVFILFFAWFGFNAGSLLVFNDTVSLILLNTLIGASFGGIAGWLLTFISKEKVAIEIFAFGIVSGLVAITAGCDQFTLVESAFVGFVATLIMFVSDKYLTHVLKIDDPLSAVAIHGVVGIWGTLCVGFFGAIPNDLSRFEFILVQGLGIFVAIITAIILGSMLFFILYKCNLLRVRKKHEVVGLNVSEHNAKLPWVDTIDSISAIMKTGNFKKKIYEERGTEVGLVAKSFNVLLDILKKEQIHLKKSNTILKQKSQIDQLTQIMNRRGLLDSLKNCNPFDANLSMIVVDIDKFKNINDTFGHNVGDSVLKELSQILKTEVKGKSKVARWGGEEFVVIVYTKDINITQNLAEKLRKLIEKFPFTTVKKLTASFGVSIAKNKEESFDDIFEKSDKALYQAKELGRNRVCTF